MNKRSQQAVLSEHVGVQPGLLPETFIRWQLDTRRAMLETVAAGRHPRRFAAHLPVMITFASNGPFPVRVATKGAGLTPRDEVLDRYISLLEKTLARCEGRPWAETLSDRVRAVRSLLDHPEDIDQQRLGFLEIFRGGTYTNLQRDSRVVLHYTGDGPKYPSFQINGYAEILKADDPRYRFIALARRIFETAPFHLPQPGYTAAYLVQVREVLDKTPYSLASHQHRKHPPAIAEHPGAENGRQRTVDAKPAVSSSSPPAVTFREILVPVDNSNYSAWAIEIALQIAGAFQSTVVGNHVYAARLHDQRFQDMEPGLPEQYQEPTILNLQRELHNTLIGKGLKLISDSYLELLNQRCQQAGLTFAGKASEGKNYAELVRDIEASGYDLVVMGAQGVGETWRQGKRHRQVLGSVCERVTRRVTRDVLAVKNEHPLSGAFMVGIDGSDCSFAALRVTLALAKATGARVQAVAAYDPFLHKTLFHELEDALTEEAKQVFNTQAQQKLHDALIDSGIAKIYSNHLKTAQRIAAEEGPEIETHLLTGKPYATILHHIKKVQPALLALGRTGVHADKGLDIGANAENLLRLAPCHVLLVGRAFTPTWAETREVIEKHLAWTPEAVARLERVPDFARGMARRAIEDYAHRQELEVVDEQVVLAARQQLEM